MNGFDNRMKRLDSLIESVNKMTELIRKIDAKNEHSGANLERQPLHSSDPKICPGEYNRQIRHGDTRNDRQPDPNVPPTN